MIKLFDSTETEFISNGLGGLSDAISCIITEEINSEYELSMQYPIIGIHYSDLILGRLVFTKPNEYSNAQPFRIYEISKPINGVVVINAEHISYDLSGIPVNPVAPYQVDSAQDALNYMKNNAAIDCPFTFFTDIEAKGIMNVSVPKSMRSLLGSTDDSILKIYGGEYEFDSYKVVLHRNRGKDRGVTIRYGKNLTDIKQDENCASVYTGVYPYYFAEDDGLQYLDEKIIYTNGKANFTKILTLDLTSKFDEMPSQDQLRTVTEKYIVDNKIGVPSISMTVSFVTIDRDENSALLETVRLGDTVTVKFPKLGVDSISECIKTEYNAINNKYNSIELGEPSTSIADTIVDTIYSQNGTAGQVSGLNISMKKTSVGLEAEVRRATTAEGELSAALTITAEGLSSKVSKNGIISEINQSAELVNIEASKINLQGYVTILDLSGDGTTEINGKNVTTGCIMSKNYLLRDEQGNLILNPDGSTTETGEGTLINLDTGYGKYAGKFQYAWLDDEEAEKYASVELKEGFVRIWNAVKNRRLYITAEGIATTPDANNATGVIDFFSKIYGQSKEGTYYNGITVQTNNSPIGLRSKGNHIFIEPEMNQAEGNMFDFNVSSQSKYGTISWGLGTYQEEDVREYATQLRFSPDVGNPFLRVTDKENNLAPLFASNLPEKIESIKISDATFSVKTNTKGETYTLTKDGSGRITKMTDSEGKEVKITWE